MVHCLLRSGASCRTVNCRPRRASLSVKSTSYVKCEISSKLIKFYLSLLFAGISPKATEMIIDRSTGRRWASHAIKAKLTLCCDYNFSTLRSCFRWLWEMFESNYDTECDNECGPGPPIFNLPPPPRPDFLQELDKCSENSLSDFEMCEAIPVSEVLILIVNCNERVLALFASTHYLTNEQLCRSKEQFRLPTVVSCYLCFISLH